MKLSFFYVISYYLAHICILACPCVTTRTEQLRKCPMQCNSSCKIHFAILLLSLSFLLRLVLCTAEITDTQSATTASDVETEETAPASNVHCCCRCCLSSSKTCSRCDKPSLTDAWSCAALYKPPTSEPALAPVQSATPKFQVPKRLGGSQFPERLALTTSFLEKQQLTETLALLPLSTKADLGFQKIDIIVDCTYDGVTCSKMLV